MNQTDSPGTEAPEKKTFTDNMRVWTRFIIDPIVTFLAHYRLSPDLFTVVGMLAHFFLAWLIAIGEFRWAGIAMLILVYTAVQSTVYIATNVIPMLINPSDLISSASFWVGIIVLIIAVIGIVYLGLTKYKYA